MAAKLKASTVSGDKTFTSAATDDYFFLEDFNTKKATIDAAQKDANYRNKPVYVFECVGVCNPKPKSGTKDIPIL